MARKELDTNRDGYIDANLLGNIITPADGTKFLRDDQVWAVPPGTGGGGGGTPHVFSKTAPADTTVIWFQDVTA